MNPALTPSPSLMFLWLFLLFVAVAVNPGFCYGRLNGTTTARCIDSEMEALLEFKQQLIDPSNRLASWSATDADCCSWYGVRCDASTGYVLGLHLRSLAPGDFTEANGYDGYNSPSLGGKMSSALVRLKKLRYLDLSGNDFDGIPIPAFLGSMGSLRYLNLSQAGFGGTMPPQLGNLSDLLYLNLRSSNVGYVEDLEWISGLFSLKFLDLTWWNLSKAMNWEKQVLTTLLPSLQELYLSNCQLPTPQQQLVNGIINSSLSLSILDLSGNFYMGQPSKILMNWVSSLQTLNSLNLAQNGFQGPIFNEFQNMSSLRELNLNWNQFNSSIPTWLYCPTHLKVLILNQNHLSSFQPPPPLITLNFSSLSVLDLSDNRFEGLIPNELQNLTSLQKLDLKFNLFNSSISNWLYGFTRLEHLDLRWNNLEGEISNAIGNLTSLITLRMSDNYKLEGRIPMSFQNVCNLRELGLSGVKLGQDVGQVFEILSFSNSHTCVSSKLEHLYLESCQLSGNFITTHQYLSSFQNLAQLSLSSNSIFGQIPMSLGELMSLRTLDLSSNKLNGTLPFTLGRLNELEWLDISENSLDGHVLEAHFHNLTKLEGIDAAGNLLKLQVGPNWIPPFNQLGLLILRSWHIGPQFPIWLRSLKSLSFLDLSSSGISSSVPVWFWEFSSDFQSLNLSHNQIHGLIPKTIRLASRVVDLNSNYFQGPLPHVSPYSLNGLDLSNNSFSGSISNFLCDDIELGKNIQVLNLGTNLLTGEISNCWKSWSSLTAINLSNNKFHGSIPESIGTLNSLESLHLRNNNFSGRLPISLRNCSNLLVLDIGENKLIGDISDYMSNEVLSSMISLNFRSNEFSGPIPKEVCRATSLRILDLGNNFFSGTIPRCISNLVAMTRINEVTGILQVYENSGLPFYENAILQMKGKMLEYSTNVGFVRSVDLSNNRLSGGIPKEITSLLALLSLNLSHNTLTGEIPKDIGSMKGLESIDLSVNQLSGEIPQSMSSLTFLGYLNLSHNQLSGKIPTGPQLQGFNASSFADNELCGPPLLKNCNGDHAMSNDAKNEEEHDGNGVEIHWFYICMAFGFIIGFWVVMGPLLFNRGWRIMYFKFLDKVENKIWLYLYNLGVF